MNPKNIKAVPDVIDCVVFFFSYFTPKCLNVTPDVSHVVFLIDVVCGGMNQRCAGLAVSEPYLSKRCQFNVHD